MANVMLVGLKLPKQSDFDESMEELVNLAVAANETVVKILIQEAEHPTPNYYIGSGKVEEVKRIVIDNQIDKVIFDQELSPVHLRNLENALDIQVMDRTMLILVIFESRARTPEAKLQVALAYSQYMLPRVIGRHGVLSRQGASGQGKQSKGAGEQQLELDRRILRNNIARYRDELKKIVIQRRTQRQLRQKQGLFRVAIVGYTNAGKSSLLNRLMAFSMVKTEKKAMEKDMLFATLETSTRSLVLPNHRQFLLTDTVGFIRHLPHHLIEAFKSTLEEIREASYLLHVVDGSHPDYLSHIQVVQEVLDSLGAKDIPTLYVLNKMDLREQVPLEAPVPRVFASVKTGLGMDEIMQHLLQASEGLYQRLTLSIPYHQSELVGQLEQVGEIHRADYRSEDIVIEITLPKNQVGPYLPFERP